MKIQQIGLWVLVFGSVFIITSAVPDWSDTQQCSKGPSHWCTNIMNAKKCNAMRHCIQTVWEKQDVPEDNDSICQICLDMVKQARDQLESNETQSDLKAVFEGSCRLIPLKPVQKECIKVVDDFIPELVEALASQMNPQVVCSVAGLCNNAKIDKMLKEYKPNTTPASAPAPTTLPVSTTKPEQYPRRLLSCNECGSVAEIITTKFKISDRDDMLEAVLGLCGHASSFSDACANIALTYFSEFYNYLSTNMNADGICHLSGTCSAKYHQHPENVEVRSRSEIGVVALKDDIPCELCQQLIHHLQELLTANTTEIEFKMVLEGLCKQMQGFKTECLSIVDQYYDKIYSTLVDNLDANGACFLIGICPKGSGNFLGSRNIIPLIPYIEPAKINVKITKLPQNDLPVYSKQQIDSMQLPIDQLMGPKNPELLVENGQLCTLCEYFLHFLQETLATPATEEKIKDAVEHICDKFPTSLRGNCHNFVEMYGDAVIALMIQGFDPREVCPKMAMCPKNTKDIDMNVFAPAPIDVSINGQKDQSDKPTCPLCLFAVQQAQAVIKGNKSKNNIKQVLDNLCTHLPNKLKTECVDFVDTYSNELVDMLITDFTAQQICVYIKLCPASKSDSYEWANIDVLGDDELFNEVSDSESKESMEISSAPECLLCEKVIEEAEKKLGPKKSKEEIKNELSHACDKLKTKLKNECHKYVDKYGDKIAELILQEMTPKQICRELGYCLWSDDDLTSDEMFDQISVESETSDIVQLPDGVNSGDAKDPPPCVLCEFVITKLETELKDKKTQEEIKREVENICKKMPKTISASCDQFITKYGDLIISLLQTLPPKVICQKLQLCHALDNKINDQIIECGVCHGATSSLVPYINEQEEKAVDPQAMIEVGCDNLPAKYYKKCSELLEYYGESIFNMIKFKTNQSEICAKIGKCFAEESSSLAYVRIEDNSNRVRRDEVLLGSNKCTYGPAHWCASRENAKSCGSTEFCEKKIWKNESPKI